MAETQEPVMATTEAKEPVMATRDYEISPFDDFVNQILQGNPLTVGILFSVIVVFLTIVWFIFRGSSQRRSTILLMGPCDAGKTLMFLRLVYKHFALTYTSVKENKGHFIAKIKDKILTVVDTPGHERLRSQYIEEYGPHALGIVFVIDSSTISRKTVADVAEYLYTILADPIISRNRPRVLVACNKQDQSMLAKRHTAVKSMMETEINTLRKTRSAALASTDDEPFNGSVFLGREDREFEFSHLGSLRVDFAECSCHAEEPDLTQVTNWLEEVA